MIGTAFALYLLTYSDLQLITTYPTKLRCEAQVAYIASQVSEERMGWRTFLCVQVQVPK